MPNIAMCKNDSCKMAKTCYRSDLSGTKPTPGKQCFAMFTPNGETSCDYFWPVIDGSRVDK